MTGAPKIICLSCCDAMIEQRSNSSGVLTSESDLSKIVSSFSSCNICHAVGYGSGVFAQDVASPLESSLSASKSSSSSMIDLILVVQDAKQFHEANMIINGMHYSSTMLALGSRGASFLQNIGPGVYFNPYCNISGTEVKYGVISKEKLLADLLNWQYLYIAARISYTGDFRMTVGAEDQNKVNKLIQSPGQYGRWVDMYTETLAEFRGRGLLDFTKAQNDQSSFVDCNLQDLSVRRELIRQLPKCLQKTLDTISKDNSELLGPTLAIGLTKIVAPSARIQGVKGLLTAGLSKSIKYAAAKFSKGRMSR